MKNNQQNAIVINEETNQKKSNISKKDLEVVENPSESEIEEGVAEKFVNFLFDIYDGSDINIRKDACGDIHVDVKYSNSNTPKERKRSNGKQ